jgi:hypothetical protein
VGSAAAPTAGARPGGCGALLPGGRDPERGSAVVDFVLVTVLLLALLAGVLQLALALHVRNTLIDSASEGARHGALAGSSPEAGAQRARDLISMSLSPRYDDDVSAEVVSAGGVDLVEVRVSAPLPVIGLLGPSGAIVVSGRAVLEG